MIIPCVAAEPKLLFACIFGPDKINHEANRDILVYRGSYILYIYIYIRRNSQGQPVITIEKKKSKKLHDFNFDSRFRVVPYLGRFVFLSLSDHWLIVIFTFVLLWPKI